MQGLLKLGWLRALIAAEVLVALAAAVGLWALRAQTVDADLRMLASLARAMALQADRTLGVADTVLRSTRDELARGLIVPGTAQADDVLRDRVRPLGAFRALSVFDENGVRVATSRPSSPASTSAPVADRAFFQAVRNGGASMLHIGERFTATADGLAAIGVAMSWNDAQERFRGVIALIAEPGLLEGGFDHIAPSADTRLAIHRIDGRAMGAAAPDDTLTPQQVQALRVEAAGSVTRVVALPNGRERLVAASALGRQPLTVVVSRDAAAALASWRELAWLVGVLCVAALGVTLLLALAIAREQVQRQRLEEQLQRSRKLEALGKLAGGVAHDFNNILAAVVGYGEMARSVADAGGRQAHHLDRVLQAGQRGKQLVERILAFSRGQPRRAQVFQLEPVVAEVLDHVSASMHPRSRLERELQAAQLSVRGDPTACYEAVMNLCTNALQAMPEGGTLRVTLSEQRVAQALALYDTTLAPGRYARLVVADTGAGMPAEVVARLFEPFFTTKGQRGGTGLGLAVVHGVVADMNGAVDVRSDPGKGSCFTLYLPAADAVDAPLDTAATLEPPSGQGQTVLVVDDEPALVELAEELLAGLGYEAFGLSSSEQALAEFRRDPARFDLVLTDEVMPGLAGTALARELHRLRPDLPIVLASGFGGTGLHARAAEAGVRVVVAKPLTRAELARALAAALQREFHP